MTKKIMKWSGIILGISLFLLCGVGVLSILSTGGDGWVGSVRVWLGGVTIFDVITHPSYYSFWTVMRGFWTLTFFSMSTFITIIIIVMTTLMKQKQ